MNVPVSIPNATEGTMGWNAGENDVGVTSQNSSDTQHVDYIKRNIEVCVTWVCVCCVGCYVHVQQTHAAYTSLCMYMYIWLIRHVYCHIMNNVEVHCMLYIYM